MDAKNTKVAIIFHRFGPYHYARLKALSEHCSLIAIECSEVDNTYSWRKVSDKGDFYWKTLLSTEVDIDDLGIKPIFSLINKCLSECKPDVIAIPGWSAKYSLAAMIWGLRNNIPIIIMSDSTEYDARRSKIKESVKRILLKNISSAIVAGQDHKAYLQKLGVPNDMISLGYDVVDNNYFKKEVQAARERSLSLRKEYSLPEKYFLSSNRLIPKKNLVRLIDSYALYTLHCKDKSWPLIILGDGELKYELKDKLKGAGLESKVKFVGFKQYNEIPIYYGLATVFVHASISEQWGLVVNEAMASGLPVLVSDRCGCARDLVYDNFNGFKFNPYDTEKLSCLFIKMTSISSTKLVDMGKQSEDIISRWGLNKFTNGMLKSINISLENPFPRKSLLSSKFLKLFSTIS